jgi:Rnl2 family RNA ligase
MQKKFKKYESIPNHNNQRTIDYYKELGFTLPQNKWYATEKVHGTNFSFISDGSTIDYAQRSGIIEGSFMNYQSNTPKLDSKIIALAKHLGETIQVVTEYYGAGIVNKGAIKYRNDVEKNFVAYDILLLDTNDFLPYPQNIELLDRFEIPRVQVIATGSFDELMEVDTQFKSPLAKLGSVDTYAEGIVLKPFNDIRLDTDEKERVVLKRVSDEFSENKPKKVEKTEKVVETSIVELIDSKNTEIRVGKVAAKFGILPTEKNKFAPLIIELSKDICDEIATENNIVVDANLVKKQLSQVVKAYFAGV